MEKALIIALDFNSLEEVTAFLDQFQEEKLFVKVGMELFYSAGPSIITEIKKRGHQIFLDLKLHDIPNTVKQAMKVLAKLDVDLVNVHAAGGKWMMEAALAGLQEGTQEGKQRPAIIAVTQLTSTTEEDMQHDQRIPLTLEQSVLSYATLASEAGLDGVVCSTHEVEAIHGKLGNDFLTVTPGIRMADDDTHDQKRIATPEKARLLGTNSIVVGRSITKATSPVEAYRLVKKAWEGTN
ncbi:orotidine-5'-phosphate decarboxylase [Bacillus sp. AGMB 02131]|uniref:Orotidine 5'-phosphate decarboxylase n=1 Tax=Peribacillus faecalis TaxID=2772559 RepID=A0A927H9S0_9BACI|nr:orotidine-5'-phosphate decarboxylase [Peribacillus faecalis]MBD3106792.1 orotidine-5'-phosphate decarboxylase [Peribacillus faecalis]